MGSYRGDIVAGTVLHLSFNTRDASGNPITLAGTPVIKAFKQGSTIACTTNPTLTVDYNSQTGLHRVIVDTSVDGAFYAAGNDFFLVATAGTVSGISIVGVEIGSFSIENRTQKANITKVAGQTANALGVVNFSNLDAAVSSRLASDAYTAPPAAGPTAVAIRQEMDANSTKLANLDATVSSRLASSAYTAPPAAGPTAVAIRQEMDANSTKLANLDATVSSRLASSAYTAPPAAGPTAVAIRQEMDANSTKLAHLTADVATQADAATIEGLLGGSGGTIVVSSFTDSALLAMRTNLNAVTVTVNGPVFNVGGLLAMQLTSGDDYSSNDSRQITLTLDGTVLPTLVGATVELCLSTPGSRVIVVGSATVQTGSSRTVVFQPTAAQTALLIPSQVGTFAVKIITATGTVITPAEARGTLNVLPPVA
jgi:hypothetical protein